MSAITEVQAPNISNKDVLAEINRATTKNFSQSNELKFFLICTKRNII